MVKVRLGLLRAVSQALSALFKALADPHRLEVALALAGGERCVCELTEQMGLAQSKLSFHLKVMREAGLLESRVQGRWVYYRLSPEALAELSDWLQRLQTSRPLKAQSCC
ncbi:MAG: ArsR family transcriptional regulator [Synechococcaceae bacterium WB7_3xG_012]|nr:ArsR family transcriptional regulator [Synechococcaceae bacterium WB7_3xG_012]PWL23710.1 MAG: ArsR family transcriptional regulator [Synechococcus sp. XM-24]